MPTTGGRKTRRTLGRVPFSRLQEPRGSDGPLLLQEKASRQERPGGGGPGVSPPRGPARAGPVRTSLAGRTSPAVLFPCGAFTPQPRLSLLCLLRITQQGPRGYSNSSLLRSLTSVRAVKPSPAVAP